MPGECFSKDTALNPDRHKRPKAASLDRDLDKPGSPKVFTSHFKALLDEILQGYLFDLRPYKQFNFIFNFIFVFLTLSLSLSKSILPGNASTNHNSIYYKIESKFAPSISVINTIGTQIVKAALST